MIADDSRFCQFCGTVVDGSLPPQGQSADEGKIPFLSMRAKWAWGVWLLLTIICFLASGSWSYYTEEMVSSILFIGIFLPLFVFGVRYRMKVKKEPLLSTLSKWVWGIWLTLTIVLVIHNIDDKWPELLICILFFGVLVPLFVFGTLYMVMPQKKVK
jgi:hypothetical protein